jgi:hypothetical protein
MCPHRERCYVEKKGDEQVGRWRTSAPVVVGAMFARASRGCQSHITNESVRLLRAMKQLVFNAAPIVIGFCTATSFVCRRGDNFPAKSDVRVARINSESVRSGVWRPAADYRPAADEFVILAIADKFIH